MRSAKIRYGRLSRLQQLISPKLWVFIPISLTEISLALAGLCSTAATEARTVTVPQRLAPLVRVRSWENAKCRIRRKRSGAYTRSVDRGVGPTRRDDRSCVALTGLLG